MPNKLKELFKPKRRGRSPPATGSNNQAELVRPKRSSSQNPTESRKTAPEEVRDHNTASSTSGNAYAEFVVRDNTRVIAGNVYGDVVFGESHSHDDREDCVKSLYFPEIRQRESAIADAHTHTFEWFWTNPKIKFRDWLASPQGLYWIRGSPGSGKSTLMKFVAHSPELNEQLAHLSPTQSYAVAFYAFFVQSSDLAGSINGMLRSILWQLMQELPQASDAVVRRYKKIKSRQPDVDWNSQDLLSASLDLIHSCRDTAICILIDGLDEHHGEDRLIAQYVDELTASLPPHARVCVASRPYPDFAFQFQNVIEFKVQEQTADDISTYIRDRFEETASFRNPAYDALARSVIEKAQGSFLWVRLACDELQKNWRKFQSLERLKSRLNALPSELEHFYQQIFERLEADEKEDLIKILTILVTSAQQLTVAKFCHIFDFARTSSDLSSLELLPSNLRSLLVDIANKRQIPSRCQCDVYKYAYTFSRLDGDSAKTTNNEDYDDEDDSSERFESYNPPRGNRLPKRGTPNMLETVYFFTKDTRRFYRYNPDPPMTSCPHTAAYTCRSSGLTVKEWHEQAVAKINMIGRGLIQADKAFVRLSHETVASFWNSAITTVWQKSSSFGHEMLLQALTSYLEMLANHHVVPEEEIEEHEVNRLYLHYPLLEYALATLNHHYSKAESISQSSQEQNMQHLARGTWHYWSARFPTRRVIFSKLPQVFSSLCLLDLAIKFDLEITIKDLIGKIIRGEPLNSKEVSFDPHRSDAIPKAPFVTNQLDTALVMTTAHDCPGATTALLRAGASPNIVVDWNCKGDDTGAHSCCALAAASFYSNIEVFQELLRNDADPMMEFDPTQGSTQPEHLGHCFRILNGFADVTDGPRTLFLIFVLEYQFHAHIETLNTICWFFQCGADLDKYGRLSETLTKEQWHWIRRAYERFYVPRNPDCVGEKLSLVRLDEYDPFVADVVERYPQRRCRRSSVRVVARKHPVIYLRS